MYLIFIEDTFEASHQVTLADGTQEPLHTHQWHVTAAVFAEKLNKDGFVMDFHRLQEFLAETIEPYRGNQLENISSFSGHTTTAEQVARTIFDAVAPRIPVPAQLGYIEVTEAAGCRARYRPSV